MLNSLLSGNEKQIVGVTLTPGIGLEAVVLERNGKTVANYSRKKVDYNFSTREIQDYQQFKTALAQALQDVGAQPKKAMVYLVLPNVFFDFIEIPPLVADDGIRTIVLSRAEEFYLFKKDEPVSGWCEIINPESNSQRKFAYTSFQTRVIDEIKEIFSELQYQLIGIESNYSATLRGLYTAGLIDDVILEQSTWTAMLISTNSYTMFYMDGKNLVNYSEVPLAIKSFSPEEAYQAVVSGASQLLSNFSSSKLYIISQTEEISAYVLQEQMQFDREVVSIESNLKYGHKESLVEVKSATDFNEAKSMTLASLGASSVKSDFSLRLNLLAGDPSANLGVYFTTNFLGQTIDVTKEFALKISIVLTVIIGLVLGLLIGGLKVYSQQLETQSSDLESQIQKIDTEIKVLESEQTTTKGGEIDMNSIIDEIANTNVTAINFYDSISSDIPKNVWLTKYYNKEGDKIAIRGIAQNIVDIYEYYKNLRVVSPQSDIKLTELKVVTDDPESQDNKFLTGLSIDKDSDRLYSFEISNTQIAVQTAGSADGKENKYNENDILSKPLLPPKETAEVEQPSEQMKPAR